MGWWPFSPLALSYQYIWFRAPPPSLSYSSAHPLPSSSPGSSHLTCHNIPGDGDGDLEVWHASPLPQSPSQTLALPSPYSSSHPSNNDHAPQPTRREGKGKNKQPAILFVHGGMGNAHVFLPTLSYLSKLGISCYAASLRGHGRSWQPGYLQMLATGKHVMAKDVLRVMKWVDEQEDGEGGLVLAGHSAGGGLVQYILANMGRGRRGKDGTAGAGEVEWEKKVIDKVRGAILMAPYPGVGSFKILLNWASFDPLLNLRMLLQFGHPNSPLSHPALTHNAFFSPSMPREEVEEFHLRICPYESLAWPLGMVRPFADPEAVARRVNPRRQRGGGEGSEGAAGKVLVMAGKGDRLMTPRIMYHLAERLRGNKEYESGDVGEDESPERTEKDVELVVVEGAHHFQNDVRKEDSMAVIADWYHKMAF
ncbi:hypothetical protein MKZ38_000816 [Zalerion maritima]|uniref:AB hydrolase-1 domain-containing protein n=1 Tax=Zalerion maritima TaxID=339359 RepID=A0AAD5RF09_9PEZI|nr:hypothetical protein MKZ38_000816 [Zalerion maritima]